MIPFSRAVAAPADLLLRARGRPLHQQVPHSRPPLEGHFFFLFFFTPVTGPRISLSLELSDTRIYAPQIRARLVTTAL